jgi:hypothetical protein
MNDGDVGKKPMKVCEMAYEGEVGTTRGKG